MHHLKPKQRFVALNGFKWSLGRITGVQLASIVPLVDLQTGKDMKLDNEIVELFRKVYSSKFNEPIDYEKAELDLKGIAYLIRITSDGAELHAHA